MTNRSIFLIPTCIAPAMEKQEVNGRKVVYIVGPSVRTNKINGLHPFNDTSQRVRRPCARRYQRFWILTRRRTLQRSRGRCLKTMGIREMMSTA